MGGRVRARGGGCECSLSGIHALRAEEKKTGKGGEGGAQARVWGGHTLAGAKRRARGPAGLHPETAQPAGPRVLEATSLADLDIILLYR